MAGATADPIATDWGGCGSPINLTRSLPSKMSPRLCGPAGSEREELLFTLRMALRRVPGGTLRDLGKRRLPSDELAEKIVAEAIVGHLELCGWRLEHKPKPRVPSAQ